MGVEGWASFSEYEESLNSVTVDCSQEIVQAVATKMSGGAGPPIVDEIALSK